MQYIFTGLTKMLVLSSQKRVHRTFDERAYYVYEKQLWQLDWYEFVHERYRVTLGGAPTVFGFSAWRIGEVFVSSAGKESQRGLRYKVSAPILNP